MIELLMTRQPRLIVGALSGRVWVVTKSVKHGDVEHAVIKHDVTEDFQWCAIELGWTPPPVSENKDDS